MVMNNICYLLNSFIHCSAYHNVIFCWVMHEQSIIDTILSRLELSDCSTKVISLVCSVESLTERLQKDVRSGKRQPDCVERSVERVLLYDVLNTVKIDVSHLTVEETAEKIASV